MAAVFVYLLRFLFIVIGYALAALAASLFLNLLVMSAVDLGHDEPLPVALGSMLFSVPLVALWIAYIAFFPAMLAILLGEMLGKRDWLYYALTGAVAAAIVIGFMTGTSETGHDLAADPGFALAVIASGMFGGIAYWLVAGRSAGAWRQPGRETTLPGPSGS